MNKESLIKAYTETEYIIPELELTLKVGETNSVLDSLQTKYCSTMWTFITAENPKSKILTDEENNQRTELLREILDNLGKPYFSAYGQGNPNWKPEKSFLVLRTSRSEAVEKLGIIFQQNAILVGQLGKATELFIIEEIFNDR